MRATVRDVFSTIVDDLPSFAPEDPSNFSLYVDVLIGSVGERGEDVFGISICTPAWMADQLADGRPRSGVHHIFVPEYDWAAVEAFINQLVSSVEADTWAELAQRLVNLGFYWEFQDYEESPEIG